MPDETILDAAPAETPVETEVLDTTPSIPDESPPESTETDGAVGVDRGDGRDVHGKFVGKAGEDAPTPVDGAPEVATEAAPAESVAPNAPLTQADGDSTAPVDEAAVWAVKAIGQEWEIPGSKVTPEGVVIPVASRELVEKYIGKGVKYESVEQQIREQRAQLQVEAARVKHFETEVNRLLEIAAITDDQQFAEAMLAYGLELRDALPTLKREAALNEREAKLQMQQAMHQPDPDEQRELIEREMVGTVDELLNDMRQHPDFGALTARDYADLKAAILRDSRLYFYQAGDRLSPEEQAAGINPGDRVFDQRRAIADGRRIATIRAEAKAEAEAARKAVEDAKRVAEQNAKKLAAAKVAAPPATPPKPAAATPTTDRAAAKEAWLREMGLLV
ncbi:MAG: hypothetical protein ACYC3L_01355 [Gemmatimonadaceae bacterium]